MGSWGRSDTLLVQLRTVQGTEMTFLWGEAPDHQKKMKDHPNKSHNVTAPADARRLASSATGPFAFTGSLK